jgi:small redox-active disulfide protein 2
MKKIQILGTGCAKCNELAANAREAAQVLGEDAEFEKVTNINDIMKFGVMTTPGLAIDGQVVSQGKVLKPDQIMKFIRPVGSAE